MKKVYVISIMLMFSSAQGNIEQSLATLDQQLNKIFAEVDLPTKIKNIITAKLTKEKQNTFLKTIEKKLTLSEQEKQNIEANAKVDSKNKKKLEDAFKKIPRETNYKNQKKYIQYYKDKCTETLPDQTENVTNEIENIKKLTLEKFTKELANYIKNYNDNIKAKTELDDKSLISLANLNLSSGESLALTKKKKNFNQALCNKLKKLVKFDKVIKIKKKKDTTKERKPLETVDFSIQLFEKLKQQKDTIIEAILKNSKSSYEKLLEQFKKPTIDINNRYKLYIQLKKSTTIPEQKEEINKLYLSCDH